MKLYVLLKKNIFFILGVVLVTSIFLASCGGSSTSPVTKVKPTPTPSPTPTEIPSPTPTLPRPTPTPKPSYPPPVSPSATLGIEADVHINYTNVPWVRLSYPTCGNGNEQGSVLKNTIQNYHNQHVRVLLLICQWGTGTDLFDTKRLNDAAQGGADAVDCGNEQMKAGYYNRYVSPDIFARFFDNCQRAMHAVRPEIPILIGSLDPHVAGNDYGLMLGQVGYLDQMQYAMNTQVHPGGHWNWRAQAVGLIDSWHNGWPGSYVNNLAGVFSFWAQQFGVSLSSGSLGKHLWVTEGTGCFKGCGVPYDSYDIAVSHILTLITDVQTAMQYHVPLFFFSGKDFLDAGYYWPIGVLDINGHQKPLRQDLGMGARSLTLSCAVGTRTVVTQLDLLWRMYSGCSLPGNYAAILES